ncbi:hypothetical protein [uncultured Aliiroseovarius sp.]|uniref:hypothetical protein n=1 Tax=uncultured Aliiroseovarius sp. TaxID=1658783 RepID=UPI0026375182|nr:hypothetical protein [uncultured Aliiroseovarius sp.]
MKRLLLAFAFASTLMPAQAAFAGGSIERACLRADRPNATRSLCNCIQNVAEAMLTNSEQSKVAKFFSEPHRSQVTRQSDRGTDEKFWKKYKKFGKVVGQYCTR